MNNIIDLTQKLEENNAKGRSKRYNELFSKAVTNGLPQEEQDELLDILTSSNKVMEEKVSGSLSKVWTIVELFRVKESITNEEEAYVREKIQEVIDEDYY